MRGVAVALGALVVSTATLAAPARVAGAEWYRAVVFPSTVDGSEVLYEQGANFDGPPTTGTDCTVATEYWRHLTDASPTLTNAPRTTENTSWFAKGDPTNRCMTGHQGTFGTRQAVFGIGDGAAGSAISQVRIRGSGARRGSFTSDVVWTLSGVVSGGGSACMTAEEIVTFDGDGSDPGPVVEFDVVVDVPTTCVELRITPTGPTGAMSAWVDELSVTASLIGEGIAGGDCIGTGGLAWGTAGLTTTHPWYGDGASPYGTAPAGWGDGWAPGPPETACRHTLDQATYVYQFQTGELGGVGDTYQLQTAFWCLSEGTRCGVRIHWVNASGANIPGSAGEYIYDGVGTGSHEGTEDAAPGVFVRSNLPAGATGVAFIVERATFLVTNGVGLVEGTPADGEEGVEPGPGGRPGGGDYFELCVQPDGGSFLDTLINVGGWVGWVGCMVSEGARWTVDAIGNLAWAIAGALAPIFAPFVDFLNLDTLLEGILGFVEDTVTAIIGLPGAIWDLFTGLMEDLFIPTTLGESWDEFTDTVGGKAPFGWFGQVSAAVSSGLGGTGSLPSLSLFGVSVTGPLTATLSAMAPFRGLILAGVALVMVIGCLRWIMAAVGVSPSHTTEAAS